LTEAIINLETVNPIEFFGINNNKFEILKRKFPLLKILSRGSQIKITGQPAEVINAQNKISQIIQYLERNGHLSENYFSKIIGDDENGDTAPEDLNNNNNDILVFGPNGRVIRAKTQNQKHLQLQFCGILSLIKNDVRIIECAPAHIGKRGYFYNPVCHVVVKFVAGYHIIKRII